ncbi:hypothetical protein B0H13DRAFT_2439244 [Mycena leptocephala]|nr:hypothetical protein B0H13DRAFT_2439244 [Mycena leptocephala]
MSLSERYGLDDNLPVDRIDNAPSGKLIPRSLLGGVVLRMRKSSLSPDMPSNSKVNSKRKGSKKPFKLFRRKQDSPQSTDTDSTQPNTGLSQAATPDVHAAPSDSPPADGSSIPRETEAPLTRGVTEDAVVSNISLALDVAEKLAGYFRTVPFVAPAAGLLSQGLKVYKEVKDTHDERDRLLARVTCINQDLCATILRMEGTSHGDLLMRLKSDVETYAGFKTNRLVDLAIQQGDMKGALIEVYDMVSITYEKVCLLELSIVDKFEEWLGPLPNMKEKQYETQKIRKAGTGNWLLNNNKFIQWGENPGLLWIQGNFIDDLFRDQQHFNDLRKPSAVAFFHFDFKDKAGHTIERALRHIILQFSASSPYHYRALEEQHKVSNGATLPTYQDLQHILRTLLREIGRTYLVLDALDECGEELEQLMDLISRLRFKDVACISLDSHITEGDIKLFVDKELRESQKLETWVPHADEISNRVVSRSGVDLGFGLVLRFELVRVLRKERSLNGGSFDAFVLVPGLPTETYREHGGRLLRQRHDLRAIVGHNGLGLHLLGTGTLRKAIPIKALDDIASNFLQVAVRPAVRFQFWSSVRGDQSR